jgi:adenine/guanine phosphoribosyltransferase-like PRPP-binding protein
MQQNAFEAALRLILPGPGDQPLMRILRIAMDIADCPAALIGVRWTDSFQTIVSAGIPLSDFRVNLSRSDAIATRLQSACIIEDASIDPDFAQHPYVLGSAKWRFIASVPLPLSVLPFDVVLNCADSRMGRARRADILERLEECAAIAADELRLIGDIASQSESIAEVTATSSLRSEGVREAGMPMALVGSGGKLHLVNRRLSSLLGLRGEPDPSVTLPQLFPMDAAQIAGRLDQVLSDGTPANAIVARRADKRKTYLIDLIRVISADSTQPMALCTVTDRTRTFALSEQLAEPEPESPNVVADFLHDTLIMQKRLLRRGPVPYHALRRWRATIKDSQMSALKALKRHPSSHFVDAVAEELAGAAASLFGERTMSAVTAVPCGNSGPDCLAARLAAAVAKRLNLPHIAAFADLPRTGGSHPRGNTRRPAMQLTQPVTEPVLLIDDVATSGAHLAEAAIALKEGGAPAVLPLVWIADA